MDEVKLHNRTHWLYTHFFHFFDIPHFLPYELVKKFLKKWNKYFNSRDDLADAIVDKDASLEASNIAGILDVIGSLTSENENMQSAVEEIITANKNDKNILESNFNSFKDMLNDIIEWQNKYNWKTT